MYSNNADRIHNGHPDAVTSGKKTMVLIVEDEIEIAQTVAAYLARDGLQTAHALDGEMALDMHRELMPQLVLLDVQMPKLDGYRVLSLLRERGDTPVIMLTAHDQDIDKLTALRIGADDYIVKPFNPAEVAARVAAVLRRSLKQVPTDTSSLRYDDLEMDLDAYVAYINQQGTRTSLNLTVTEFRLLVHMARAPRRVFSRQQLIVACLPDGNALERTVDSHLSKLRKKLDDAGVGHLLVSLRGVGYRIEDVK